MDYPNFSSKSKNNPPDTKNEKLLISNKNSNKSNNKTYDNEHKSSDNVFNINQSVEPINKELVKNNFFHTKQKVSVNLELINSYLNDLQDQIYKIEPFDDNSKSMEISRDEIITKLGQIFNETYNIIQFYMEYNYKNKNDKIENIKEAKLLEKKCNKYKSKFDKTLKKLSLTDKESINRKDSKRFSIGSLKVPSVSYAVFQNNPANNEEGQINNKDDIYFQNLDAQLFIEGKENSIKMMENVCNEVNRFSILTEERIKKTAKELGIVDLELNTNTVIDKDLLFKDPPDVYRKNLMIFIVFTLIFILSFLYIYK